MEQTDKRKQDKLKFDRVINLGFYAGTAEISVTSVSAQQPVHPGQ